MPMDKVIANNYDINFKNPNRKEEKQTYTLGEFIGKIEAASNNIHNAVKELKELTKDIIDL